MTNDEILSAAIQVLNEALKADSAAMNELMGRRVQCNAALADHPTIQVGYHDGTTVRPIGLINGILEPICGKVICMMQDEDDKIIGFGRYDDYKPKD